jgi:hypothetical protein
VASSFGAATIRVLRDLSTGALPGPLPASYQSARHPPSAAGDVVQYTGTGDDVVVYRLRLTTAEYAALKALLQTKAELTLAGVSQGDWWLEAFSNRDDEIGGVLEVDARFRAD